MQFGKCTDDTLHFLLRAAMVTRTPTSRWTKSSVSKERGQTGSDAYHNATGKDMGCGRGWLRIPPMIETEWITFAMATDISAQGSIEGSLP